MDFDLSIFSAMSDHDQLQTDREVQNFKATLSIRFQRPTNKTLNLEENFVNLTESPVIRRKIASIGKARGNTNY